MKYTRFEYDSMIETLKDCYIFSMTNIDKVIFHNKNIDKIIDIIKEAKANDGKK